MGARGCLVGLLGVVAGLGLLAQGADVGARHLATSKVQRRVAQSVPEAKGVHAWIRSFPFMKVAVNGRVDEIGVRVAQVVEKPLVFSDVTVDLRGVRLSVSDLLTQAQINVVGLDRGTITMSVSEASIEQALPATTAAVLRAASGSAKVTVKPVARQLVISVAGAAAVDLPLPKANLLPCTPTVTDLPGRFVLGCQFTAVPRAFTTSTTSAT